MSIANIRPEHFEALHLLLEHDLADPVSVFEHTFVDHHLWELKDYLWNAQEVCMLTEIAPFQEIEGREECLTYTFSIMKCLEAAKLIADQRKAVSTTDAEDPEVKYKNIDSLSQDGLRAAHEYYSQKLAFFLAKYQEMVAIICRIINRMMKERNEAKETVG